MSNNLLDLLKLIETESDDSKIVKEYGFGGKRMGAKYMQRLGSPGHYKYVYAPSSINRFSRKAKFYYSRFLKRSAKFLKSIALSYDAKALNVKPKTWRTAIVNIQQNSGLNLMLHVDLKSHQIYSYKSHRGQMGASTKLSRAKKKGILRFR